MTDFWLALTAVGTLVLGAATAFLAWQTRASVKLGREQTSALREQAAAAREELDELRRERREDARPVVRWELIDSWAEARAMGQDDLIYGVVRCKVVNYGGHALVSNLDFTERPQVDTEPRYVRELLPTGRELPILFRFGPFRRDLTSTVQAAWHVDVRPLLYEEVTKLKARLLCRVTVDGVTVEDLRSEVEPT